MARKVVPPSKFVAPKLGDKADLRCVFVQKYEEPGVHSRLTTMDWCSGCGFYVCDNCDKRPPEAMGKHDVTDHQPEDPDDFDEN